MNIQSKIKKKQHKIKQLKFDIPQIQYTNSAQKSNTNVFIGENQRESPKTRFSENFHV